MDVPSLFHRVKYHDRIWIVRALLGHQQCRS